MVDWQPGQMIRKITGEKETDAEGNKVITANRLIWYPNRREIVFDQNTPDAKSFFGIDRVDYLDSGLKRIKDMTQFTIEGATRHSSGHTDASTVVFFRGLAKAIIRDNEITIT